MSNKLKAALPKVSALGFLGSAIRPQEAKAPPPMPPTMLAPSRTGTVVAAASTSDRACVSPALNIKPQLKVAGILSEISPTQAHMKHHIKAMLAGPLTELHEAGKAESSLRESSTSSTPQPMKTGMAIVPTGMKNIKADWNSTLPPVR
eukprot:CAMPEP_0115471674 /NCGR_PEP_ID=MMETSP0271-20121206/52646_1 /TAXON_ID=71861 /ORGANISM="Scrippsiella trochoidea, Strain CCMP3099" /LENGTH=147 /DNA_ID=CAMNT_0002898869 /DNA_START=142 /DNA_END=586 /DNA_ORIENTATION=-